MFNFHDTKRTGGRISRRPAGKANRKRIRTDDNVKNKDILAWDAWEPLDSRRAGQTNLSTRRNSEELELRESKWICENEIAKWRKQRPKFTTTVAPLVESVRRLSIAITSIGSLRAKPPRKSFDADKINSTTDP
ncbi:hypothetical protein PUN28_002319 [Cardiocondyla obscurior]|uniref:Uncharacterized protein n=1 Tax=Cardiocondyla obscurior TaxID=286306 RepID=A0AAW2GTN9_9HYME